jgi:hypothetical protein
VALREAQRLTASAHRHQLPQREGERLYLQVDGQLCPTREPRQSPEEQGYREAKAVLAFSQHDGAEVSKERHEILHKILSAKITACEEFRSLFASAYHQAQGPHAAEVIVLADGAHWIWNLGEALVPHAIQILDFSHAKHYLWDAGKMIYGDGSAFVAPWVKEQETLLLEDKVAQVIAHLQGFLNIRPQLAAVLHYFEHHAARNSQYEDCLSGGTEEDYWGPLTSERTPDEQSVSLHRVSARVAYRDGHVSRYPQR